MIDPFAVLGVKTAASKSEILAAVAAALRARRFDSRLIAEAQKELFNPVSRAAAEFRHGIDTSRCIGRSAPPPLREADHPNLEMLDYPDEQGDEQGTAKS